MKRAVLVMALILCMGISGAMAQIAYGIKAGLNYNVADVELLSENIGLEYLKKGTGDRAGFHVGGFLRLKVPIIGIYVQPELLFTQISNSYEAKESTGEETNFGVNTNRVEVPVLIGKRFIRFLRVYTGPVFALNLKEKIDWSASTEENTDKISTAMQIGAGIDLGRISADIRYELPLNTKISEFKVPDVTDLMRFESQPSMLLLSLAYRF